MRHLSIPKALLLSLLAGGVHAALAGEEPQSTQPANPGNFTFSGYDNIVVDAPSGGKVKLLVDDLSLFITGHVNQKLNPFFEAEIAQTTLVQQGGNPLSNSYPHFVVERIYNDSYLTNSLTLRAGKMLSPVGEWNLIHAAPLVWTTIRPLTTYRGFSEFTSGLSLLYTDTKGALPDIQLYMQPGGEIRPRPLDMVVREYKHVSGLHLNWPIGLNDKLGLSVQHAQIKNTGEQQMLTGFNFSKEFGHLTLETEAVHTHISGTNAARVRDNEWGSYLQGTYALNERWNLVGRHEYFADRGFAMASKNTLLGTTYKSAPSSVWKLEYVEQNGQKLKIATGLYASFSALF